MPPGVVTVTSTVVLTGPAGEFAVIVVLLTTDTPVALLAPNFTPVAPVKFAPVIVTEVPAVVGPEIGLTPVTVGRAK